MDLRRLWLVLLALGLAVTCFGCSSSRRERERRLTVVGGHQGALTSEEKADVAVGLALCRRSIDAYAGGDYRSMLALYPRDRAAVEGVYAFSLRAASHRSMGRPFDPGKVRIDLVRGVRPSDAWLRLYVPSSDDEVQNYVSERLKRRDWPESCMFLRVSYAGIETDATPHRPAPASSAEWILVKDLGEWRMWVGPGETGGPSRSAPFPMGQLDRPIGTPSLRSRLTESFVYFAVVFVVLLLLLKYVPQLKRSRDRSPRGWWLVAAVVLAVAGWGCLQWTMRSTKTPRVVGRHDTLTSEERADIATGLAMCRKCIDAYARRDYRGMFSLYPPDRADGEGFDAFRRRVRACRDMEGDFRPDQVRVDLIRGVSSGDGRFMLCNLVSSKSLAKYMSGRLGNSHWPESIMFFRIMYRNRMGTKLPPDDEFALVKDRGEWRMWTQAGGGCAPAGNGKFYAPF